MSENISPTARITHFSVTPTPKSLNSGTVFLVPLLTTSQKLLAYNFVIASIY